MKKSCFGTIWRLQRRERHLVRKLADEFKVSKKAVLNILKGISYAYVRPEIPRIFVMGHGGAWITDRAIQQIRATWDANPELQGKGLQAALHRRTGVSAQHLSKIVKRQIRISVSDDPEATFDISELPFKTLHHTGENHGNSIFSNEEIQEIHRLFNDEGVSQTEIGRRFGTSGVNIGCIVRGDTRVEAYAKYHGHPPKGK